ncbi:MAG: beta-lactamase family protein [Anaerolineales bacterium]|nr:beta-lactamase family protein [Anaerolineales bacterium]
MTAAAAFHAYLTDRAARDAFSGVALLTRGDETLFAEAYGYASRAWQVPAGLHTRFDIASVTKLFTAVATLQLIDQGALAFETRAVEYLQLTDTTIDPAANVYHLLTHTSGIGDDADEEAGESYAALFVARPNYSVTTTADFLPGFRHKPANFAPGQGCRYCNVGYVLLGLMIERATGLTYRDYVRRHVFAPAGMAHSGFFRMDRVEPDVAEGADPLRDAAGAVTAWKRNIYSYPPIGSPDGGAHVTSEDINRFLRAVQGGALLSPALTAAFFTPQVLYQERPGGQTEYNGYGLWFRRDAAGRVLSYAKEGINAGASAFLRHWPAAGVTVVLLSNLEDGVWRPMDFVAAQIEAGEWGTG